MSLTILQTPTSPNVTGTNLIYTVSSSAIPAFQYRYVVDIYESGSSTKLTRFKYPQNSNGTVNAEISRTLDDYLDYDYNWDISTKSSFTSSVKTFDIKFGDEYGTSYNSVVTVNPDQISSSIQVFKGSVYPSETTYGFNWNSGSKLLTNSPTTQSFLPTEYLTVPVYNTDVTVKYYLTGSLTATQNYVSTGDFSAIPISPLNISNYTESDAITLDVTGSSIRYELNTDCRNDERTSFAFINRNGFWDYYTSNTPTRRNTQIDRKTYEQPFVDLNAYQATYNAANRGETQYYTEYTDEFEITTDQLTSTESQWLRELLESDEVFIQSGSTFIPINILNSSEQISNSTFRNKNFQYTIRYQFSNLREPR